MHIHFDINASADNIQKLINELASDGTLADSMGIVVASVNLVDARNVIDKLFKRNLISAATRSQIEGPLKEAEQSLIQTSKLSKMATVAQKDVLTTFIDN